MSIASRVIVGAAFGLLGVLASQAAAPAPDLILFNGKVVTVDQGFTIARAVAVTSSRIAAVGPDDRIRALAGPGTKVVDLGGRTVVPGLWDSHNHQFSRAEMLRDVDLTKISSIADIQKAIRERARTVPPGEWILGSRGWWEYQLAEGRIPTREDLDAATTDHPVAIAGPHYRIANSRALMLSEITKNTPDPPGGEIWKDATTGEPMGLLMDRAGQLLKTRPAPPTPEEQRANLLAMVRRQNAVGVSGVREPGVPPEAVGVYRQLLDAGQLTQRVDLWYRVDPLEPLDAIERRVKQFEAPGTVYGDGMIRISGIKMGIDGAEQSAFLREDYPDKPGYRGLQFLPTAQYAKVCELLNRLGWPVTTHAVGDAAIDQVLDSYDAANRQRSIVGKRWAIEHAFLVRPDHIPRVKQLGLTINSQYMHNSELGQLILRAWKDRMANMSEPFKTWMDAGVVLAGGSDGPTSYKAEPMLILHGSITRKTLWGGSLGPEQKLTREQALRTLTINAAYAAFQEKTLGSLETGKYADLTVLSDDYLTVPEDRIPSITPVAMIIAGKVVHGALPGAESR